MTTVKTDRLVDDYLHRLEAAAAALPPERRSELVTDIRAHVDEALQAAGATNEVAVRNVLERLGSPEEIASAAVDAPPAAQVASRRTFELVALLMLIGGGFLPVIGGLPVIILGVFIVLVGLILVAMSGLWTARDKRVALLLGPLLALMPFFILSMLGEEITPQFLFVLFFVSMGLGGALYLAWRLAHPLPQPRRETLLAGVLLAYIVLGAAIGALNLLAWGGSDEAHPPEITDVQLNRVALGDTKQTVAQMLGGAGDSGSIVSGLDPIAVESPHDVGKQQFDDCWSYSVTGTDVGTGSDAAVCFVADQVVFTRVRLVRPR